MRFGQPYTWTQVENDLEAYALGQMRAVSPDRILSPGNAPPLLHIGDAGVVRHAAHHAARLQVCVGEGPCGCENVADLAPWV